MSEELLNIEVDGQPLKARKGAMIIHATDEAGIHVPRFCYHARLPIAANCRMCLVEVEKAPKPMPACATPLMEGMKIFTKSPRALAAQKATMEFLLINHPLDCPICDQGGECELQDLAMGYGRDASRYTERKRVVADKDIGPLISTDMTRCIHCTRCVRFGQDIAGMPELGATGRGENTVIGTFIAKSVDHELSGNVIDLCPVGALNSKPFRMRGRSWEMQQVALISPHDGIGSNLWGHVLRGKLMRVVPRENDAINESWISDRDRFSYEAVHAADRLQKPMVRKGQQWLEVSWEVALEIAATGFKSVLERQGGAQLAFLSGASSTLEEGYLLQKLARSLGSDNVDHRLRRSDLRDAAHDPVAPVLGKPLADFERDAAILVVGAHAREDAPLFGHRLRKAALKGAAIGFINPRHHDYLFPVAAEAVVDEAGAVETLAALLKAVAAKSGKSVPAHLAACTAKAGDADASLVALLTREGARSLVLGPWALAHPQYADLRALAAALAELVGATYGELASGANAAGLSLAGVLPHRQAGGAPSAQPGVAADTLLREPRRAYLLLNMEAELDAHAGAQAIETLKRAETVVVLTPFVTAAMKDYATVLLPVGTFAETSGTFVNAEGRWQTFTGAQQPVADARPAWKVLRVLGNQFGQSGFEHQSSEEVREELRAKVGEAVHSMRYTGQHAATLANRGPGVTRSFETPLYAGDMLARRAPALGATAAARDALCVRLAPATAQKHGISEGDRVMVQQGGASAALHARLDARMPADTVVLPNGVAETAGFGAAAGRVDLSRI
jgi:NADH-quinone oxidoreductase subunit G